MCPTAPLQHRRVDALRAQHAHSDAAVAVGDRHPLRQCHDGVLRHRVGRVAERGEEPRCRRGVQQVPLATLEHPGQHRADRVELAEEVDLPRGGPPRVGRLGTAAGGDPCVGAEQVDRAEGLLGRRRQPLYLTLVAHVALDCDGAAVAAVAADERDRRTRAVAVHVGDRHRGAVGSEPPGERAADPGSRAGDDHVLPGDLHERGSVLRAVGVVSGTVSVGDVLGAVLGPDLPVAFVAYDGSRCGPDDARTTVVVRSEDALRRIVTAPDELGFGRAYVAGDLSIEGDVFDVIAMQDQLENVKVTPTQIVAALKLLGVKALRPLPPPPEEARLHGRRHSKARDAAAISFHYDVSNDFYRIVLGPSLTYSCAVWTDTTTTLEQAQANKHELVSRQAGPRARDAPARHRVWMGRDGAPRGEGARRARGRRDAVEAAGRPRAEAGGRAGRRRSRRDPARRLPRRRRRPVRRHLVDRHVRARRAHPAR